MPKVQDTIDGSVYDVVSFHPEDPRPVVMRLEEDGGTIQRNGQTIHIPPKTADPHGDAWLDALFAMRVPDLRLPEPIPMPGPVPVPPSRYDDFEGHLPGPPPDFRLPVFVEYLLGKQ